MATKSDLVPITSTRLVKVLDKHAAEIRRLGKRVVADIIDIGRHLSEAKGICGHGGFLPWLDREFGWSGKTAENFINVYKLSGKFENFSNLDLPLSGLYLLAAPSTPDGARTEIIERAQAGESVAVADVKQTIAEQRAVTSGLTYRVPATVADMLPPKQKSVVYPPNPTWRTDSEKPPTEPRKPERKPKQNDLEDAIAAADKSTPSAAPNNKSKSETVSNSDSRKAREDIGPESTTEMARKDAEIEELRSAKRMLEIKITGLESENQELKQRAAKPIGDEPLTVLVELLRQILTDASQPAWLKPLSPHKQQQARKLVERLRSDLFELVELRQTAAKAMPDIPPLPSGSDYPDIPDFLLRAAS